MKCRIGCPLLHMTTPGPPPDSARPARTGSAYRGTAAVCESALAVLRLTTDSIFTACWTGRSAGLSPLRMRPEIVELCRAIRLRQLQ